MKFKIDTKEKFSVFTPEATELSAIMTENLRNLLLDCMKSSLPNLVLNMKDVVSLSLEAGEMLLAVQQEFYEKGNSFVICELKPELEDELDKAGILEMLNITPTESEAWDILQMEEIERELLGDDDKENNDK
jgi:anti-anti-sigma factor